ncbi:CHAT domain-containing protein [Anatilimnocola floriformis]|uniref:CHAT domain-containing protein n=1 Tax=Anatilimnocola floriformis TaxID=2948575 RepID=UPI0020C3901D|nr:CHAT domain-containing protein [Anatilimnocola floriformis]
MRRTFSLSIFFLLLASGLAGAQTQEDWDERALLSRQYIQLSRSGRIDDSLTIANRHAELVESRFAKRDHFLASMYVGEALINSGKYKESMVKWQQTIERLKDFTPRTEQERYQLLLTHGDALRSIGLCYANLGDAAEALKYYEATADWWAKAKHADVTRLVVIPDGPLALLPFETLVVKNEGEPEYLLDAGPAIAYAPSATILLNPAERKASTATEQKLFALGDPNYAAATGADALDRTLGISRTVDRFRSGLSKLPSTGLEANWIQQNLEKIGFTTTKVLGAEATEAAIRRHAPGKQIIHMACHGMADQSYGNFFGSLAVAPGRAGDSRDDGFLSMSEIYELNLDGCELAILSACETNYGPQQQGEGVWALSRGFLVAGSRRVVASNWVVDDLAGATLICYFSNYLAQAGKEPIDRDYATALLKAKRQIRKDANWKHPFYWSSLVLVGPK